MEKIGGVEIKWNLELLGVPIPGSAFIRLKHGVIYVFAAGMVRCHA
jgi:expansin (peptidoglycan-binding protein)